MDTVCSLQYETRSTTGKVYLFYFCRFPHRTVTAQSGNLHEILRNDSNQPLNPSVSVNYTIAKSEEISEISLIAAA